MSDIAIKQASVNNRRYDDTVKTAGSSLSLVEHWRPAREINRPAACDNGRICWVRDGKAAASNPGSSRTCCLGCRGKIGRNPVPLDLIKRLAALVPVE